MARSSLKLGGMRHLWQGLSPVTKGLLGLLIGSALIALLSASVALSDRFIFDVAVRSRELPPYHVWQFFTLHQDLDSWQPMWQAFEQLKAAPRTPLYAEVFFEQHTKFQYPLTSLLLFYGLQGVLAPFNPGYPQTLYFVLMLASWLSVVVLLVFSIKIFNHSLQQVEKHPKVPAPSRSETILRNVFLIALGLTFYPAIRAYSLGQIQAWINAIFAVMLWCWIKDKKQISGVLGGLVCLIKPQYAVILLWGLLRRQWRFSITFMSVTLAGWLLAIAMFGITNNLDYLKVLSFISKHGEAYYPNQSVNGLLNRLLFNGSNLTWTGDAFAPFHPLVYAGTLISSIVLLICALRPPAKQRAGSSLDFVIVSLTATMASPVAWEHHYGILLPIYAMLLPQIFAFRVWSALTLPLLSLSYLLASKLLVYCQKICQPAAVKYRPVLSFVRCADCVVEPLPAARWRWCSLTFENSPFAGRAQF